MGSDLAHTVGSYSESSYIDLTTKKYNSCAKSKNGHIDSKIDRDNSCA
jgi:hypothetical protein